MCNDPGVVDVPAFVVVGLHFKEGAREGNDCGEERDEGADPRSSLLEEGSK
jgi:hypothetical protein